MRKALTGALLSVLLVSPFLWATKAEKEAKRVDRELRRISLVAAVIDGRRAVNRVMAKELGVSRSQLVQERRQTGFVYGQLYGAHEVGHLADLSFSRVAAEMKQGHSLFEISERHEVDLGQVLADTKKLNRKIEQELNHVARGEEENQQAEDKADAYDPSDDTLSADTADFSPAEIAQASEQVHNPGLRLGQGGFAGGPGRAGGTGLGPGSAVGHGGRGPH